MRKLYAFLFSLIALGVFATEVATAQTYAISDYLVRKVDAPDAQGLGSGSNWVEIQGTNVLDGYLQQAQGDFGAYCSLGKQIPFNFRFLNQQVTTSNTFSITDCGGVILSPNWPANASYYPYAHYDNISGYVYGLNNASNYCYEYNYWSQTEQNYGSYGYYANYVLSPFGGYCYNYYGGLTANVPTYSYAVLGSAPNRELVVQAKNQHPMYDYAYGGSATTRSYQTVIYENAISAFQFNYGPTNGNPRNPYTTMYGGGAWTINGWTFPGSWDYYYNYNYGSYAYLSGYPALVGMKTTAGQGITVDFNGNGWDASRPFVYKYSTTNNYTNGVKYGTYSYGTGYTSNSTAGGTVAGDCMPFMPDTAYYLPRSSIKIFLAYDFDFTATSIVNPANQATKAKNVPFTPQVLVTNAGRQVPTSVQVNLTMTMANGPQVYNQTVTLSGAQVPGAFASGTVSFPAFTPNDVVVGGVTYPGWNVYFDTAVVFGLSPTADQNAGDNTTTNEWISAPPNDIKAVTILNPSTGTSGRTPIAVNTPVQMRFRNLGTNSQVNVPITTVIMDPSGAVVYRDTVFIPNWPAGTLGGNSDAVVSYATTGTGPGKGAYYDTTFKDWTPSTNGIHKVCGIAIMSNDQLRADDTICGVVRVLFPNDVAGMQIVNPQPDEEKPYFTLWQPSALFASVGVADLFDIPVRVQIRRCTDGALVFQADTIMPELNVDNGNVRLWFPAAQGPYSTSRLTPGCYNICAIARYPTDGDRTNDTTCSSFSIIDRLKGNIFVGVGQRFQTIHAAVDSMRFRGIGGHLNLIMTDANYTENGTYKVSSPKGALDFTGISGLSDTSRVTWMAKPGVTPTITFTGSRPSCFFFGDLFGGYMKFEGYNPIGVPIPDKLVTEPNKRGMTIINNQTSASPIFRIEQGASNITLRNLRMKGSGQFSNDSNAIVDIYNEQNRTLYINRVLDTVPINHIFVDNCELGNAKYGIRDHGLHDQFNIGKSVFIVWRNNTNAFTRNTIGSASWPLSFAGIQVQNEQDLMIAHNEVSNVDANLAGAAGSTWNAFGILQPAPSQYQAPGPGNPGWLADTGNVVRVAVDANKVHNISAFGGNAYGIAFQQSVTIYSIGGGVNVVLSQLPIVTQNRATNNMVYDLRSKAGSVYPIVFNTAGGLYSADRDSIFNNSISTNKAAINIQVQNAKHVFLWNNIIQNTSNTASTNYALTVARPFEQAISSDYNLFDLNANNTFATVTEYDARYAVTLQTRPFRRLNDWRTFLGQDLHSVIGNPMYANDSLHMPGALSYIESPASNNGAWFGSNLQARDFDGELRLMGNQTPDIGADEFEGFQYTNDLAVMSINQPKGYSLTSDTALITIENPLWLNATVKNLSSQAVFNRSVNAMVEVAISGGPWQTIYSNNTANMTWDVNESKNIAWQGPTLTTNQVQNGVFRVTVTTPNDQFNSNNSQVKYFRVLLKSNATVVSYNGSSIEGRRNRDSVTAGLRRLGVPYDSIDRNAPNGSLPTTDIDYTAWWNVIWAGGTPTVAPVNGQPTAQGGLSFKETQELRRYVMSGQSYAKKSIIMAGQNIAFYNDFAKSNNVVTDSEFMRSYLHTQYVATQPTAGAYNGQIVGMQPTHWKFPESITSTSPDVVKPSIVTPLVGPEVNGFAYAYATHPSTPSDSGAGVSYYNNLVNTVFYAFDWYDPIQTTPSEAGYLTSGTTRALSAALAFVTSHSGTVLPVEFSNVTATRAHSNAVIAWSTANQSDLARFDIESKTADNWQPIGSVNASSKDADQYSFQHEGISATKSYTYRVVAIDKSGAKTYSNTVELAPGTPVGYDLGQNRPNPASDVTTISLSLPTDATVTIHLMDVTGKVVATPVANQPMTVGQQQVAVNVSNLASGSYLYEVVAVGADGHTTTLSKIMTVTR